MCNVSLTTDKMSFKWPLNVLYLRTKVSLQKRDKRHFVLFLILHQGHNVLGAKDIMSLVQRTFCPCRKSKKRTKCPFSFGGHFVLFIKIKSAAVLERTFCLLIFEETKCLFFVPQMSFFFSSDPTGKLCKVFTSKESWAISSPSYCKGLTIRR